MPEQVILVNEYDSQIGMEEKIAAHKAGKLHRAFSVFVFNAQGQMLLQKRAQAKYHSGGLWSNTCCSHPRPGEQIENAAHRRLREEMGFDCPLKEIHSFTYRAEYENGITEHEYNHVLTGEYNGKFVVDPAEAADGRWVEQERLKKDVKAHPENYSVWFKICLEEVLKRAKV